MARHLPKPTFSVPFHRQERIAGLVVEQNRVRFAEFQGAGKERGGAKQRILMREGAVLLSENTIRDGVLVNPGSLTQALRELRERGSPHALSTGRVVLSLPLAHIAGRVLNLPLSLKQEEVGGAARLEAERILPFPLDDAHFDWQEVRGSEEHKGKPAPEGRRVFFIAARKNDVDPYVRAAEAAGLRVIAVEPVTLSIARGLEERTGSTFIALVSVDALVVAGFDRSGNIRFFHHKEIPPASVSGISESSQLRAQTIASELTSFIRFFRSEVGGDEQELVVEGVLDAVAFDALGGMAQGLSLALRVEEAGHGLSRAAVRGAALRALLPRADDKLISLTTVGTEEAFVEARSGFFTRFALRVAVGATVLSALMLGGTLAYLMVKERLLRLDTGRQPVISAQTQEALETITRINAAAESALALVSIPEVPQTLVSALRDAAPPGISFVRIAARTGDGDGVIRVDVAGQAETFADYNRFIETLRSRFTDDSFEIPAEYFITKPKNIPITFSFTLRPDI